MTSPTSKLGLETVARFCARAFDLRWSSLG